MSLSLLIIAIYIAGTIIYSLHLSLDLYTTIEIANKVWHKPSKLKLSFLLACVSMSWPISAISIMIDIMKDNNK